ncbi:prostatic acid phosphatase-like isoform X1 [Rhodnius prolixus]|uniref:prostatic acid phosphatase-like isoform X1 n=1 Tax=Rhodnius prolixus TaxID=13249 RepID=UPI003D18A9C9
MFKKICIFFSFLLTVQICSGRSLMHLDNEFGEVIFVNILYRHGERTPLDPYPNDPYKNLSYWPCDWGQLTNTGKLHHYVLGTWLRSRYANLLPEGKYNNRAIYVLSTNTDRTLMSAESNLAGMFPPAPAEKWGALNWQPIPVHSFSEDDDKLLAMNAPCKRYEVEYERAMSSPEMVKINEKYKPLYEYLTIHSGKEVDKIHVVEYFYSTLYIESLANLTLPDWTKKVFPDQLKEVAGLSFVTPTFTSELKRLKGGPLVKDMLEHMTEKIEGKLERNISVYSAHDTTVSNLLNTLGVFNKLPPPFAATVLVELRRNLKNNEHYVTVLYKNTTGDPHVLTIPGCTEACPLHKLKALLFDVIPIDWDTECHAHDLFDLSSGQPYHSLAIFGDLNQNKDNTPFLYQVV